MWKDILRVSAAVLLLSSCGKSIDPDGGGTGGGGTGGGGGGTGGGGTGGGGGTPGRNCPVSVWTVSTIRVVSGPQPCNDGSLWNGWNCVVLESTANNSGVAYQVEARWNRVGQASRGSWTWLVGGASGNFFREGQNKANIAQDQLASQDQIRSIDTKFVGGRGASPRNGDVNLSIVFADVIHWLADNGIHEGVKGYFGSSAGAATGAAALANHGLDSILDGMVYGAGPTFIDLENVCAPGGASQQLRRGLDERTYVDLTGQRPCEQMRPDLADPSFDCMSILGSEADTDYPDTRVAVLLGATDPDLGFIEPQSRLYVSMLSAEATSVDVIAATPHNVLKTDAGLALVLQRIREIVDAG